MTQSACESGMIGSSDINWHSVSPAPFLPSWWKPGCQIWVEWSVDQKYIKNALLPMYYDTYVFYCITVNQLATFTSLLIWACLNWTSLVKLWSGLFCWLIRAVEPVFSPAFQSACIPLALQQTRNSLISYTSPYACSLTHTRYNVRVRGLILAVEYK